MNIFSLPSLMFIRLSKEYFEQVIISFIFNLNRTVNKLFLFNFTPSKIPSFCVPNNPINFSFFSFIEIKSQYLERCKISEVEWKMLSWWTISSDFTHHLWNSVELQIYLQFKGNRCDLHGTVKNKSFFRKRIREETKICLEWLQRRSVESMCGKFCNNGVDISAGGVDNIYTVRRIPVRNTQ